MGDMCGYPRCLTLSTQQQSELQLKACGRIVDWESGGMRPLLGSRCMGPSRGSWA